MKLRKLDSRAGMIGFIVMLISILGDWIREYGNNTGRCSSCDRGRMGGRSGFGQYIRSRSSWWRSSCRLMAVTVHRMCLVGASGRDYSADSLHCKENKLR